jgi:hypothetical protein
MFLDDYGDDEYKSQSFTKKYIISKSYKFDGKNPLSENNTCFYIKCAKNIVGYRPISDEMLKKNKEDIKLVETPITDLIQHKVECVVSINHYRFKKNNSLIKGWNLKLIKMTLVGL